MFMERRRFLQLVFKKIRLAVYLPMEGRFNLLKKNALKKLNQHPKDTLYVGDNWRDLEAARNANITPVFAEYGYIKDKEFPPNKNGFNIKNIKEILTFT